MRTRGILAAAALAAIPALAYAAETCTDVALVLLADVSYSMKDDERRIQRDGYAQAFRHPEVIQAITGGYCGRIDVAYVEYADKAHVVVDWRTVDGPAAAFALSQAIADAPHPGVGHQTGVAGAMRIGGALLLQREANRHVMDVSSDGPDNLTRDTDKVRDAISTGTAENGWREVTINGLIVGRGDMLTSDQLADWYEANVRGGPGSFVMQAMGIHELGLIVRRKLVQEIGGLALNGRAA